MQGGRVLQQLSASSAPDTAPRNNERAGLLADLHRSPPITLRQIRESQPRLLPGAVALAVVLGIAAAVDGGRLLAWDPPVTDAFISLRSPGLDRVALWISRLGSTPVVITAGVAGVALAAQRCHSAALVMLVTVAARPPFEWLLKEAVARPRHPGLDSWRLRASRIQRPRAGRRSHMGLGAADSGFVPEAPVDVVGADHHGVERDRAHRLEPGVAGCALGLRRHRWPRHRLRRPLRGRNRARSPPPHRDKPT
jgi:hypothetical protein